MLKIFKYIGIFVGIFFLYKGFIAIKNFEIGTGDRIAQIEEAAGIEKQEEVVGLLMYLGEPPKMIEHLFMENSEKCLKLKTMAEENSNALYECALSLNVSLRVYLSKYLNCSESITLL